MQVIQGVDTYLHSNLDTLRIQVSQPIISTLMEKQTVFYKCHNFLGGIVGLLTKSKPRNSLVDLTKVFELYTTNLNLHPHTSLRFNLALNYF